MTISQMLGSGATERWRVISIARILPILHNVLVHLCKVVADTAERFVHVDADLFVPLRGAPDGSLGDVVSAHAIPQHHVQRRCRAALLAVACDAHPAQLGPAKEQAFDLVPVAVIVEMNGAVGCEEGLEVLVRESVRVSAFALEYQEVGDIDDANAQARSEFA